MHPQRPRLRPPLAARFRGARAAALAAFAAAGFAAATVQAQATDKSIVPEAVPVVPVFTQWVETVVVVVPETRPATTIATVPLALAGGSAAAAYEPWPVIIGVPELPLIGAGARASGSVWGSGYNYQGLHARLLVLDATGQRVETRRLSDPVRAGERFKIRVTATFGAVAEVGQVVGEAWSRQRSGQLYPAQGMSVQMNPGETVDLPMGGDEFFVMGDSASQRLLLSVRHARAVGAARSTQPAYRQDVRNGSSYLQLVPRGQYPAIEQLLAASR